MSESARTVELLREQLVEARRLLWLWLEWGEHRHLSDDEFATLVHDTQAAVDGEVPT